MRKFLATSIACVTAVVTSAMAGAQTFDLHAFVPDTDVVSAGIGGMRGLNSGTIPVSGVTGTVTKAFLIWSAQSHLSDPDTIASVNLNGIPVSSVFTGIDGGTCWGYPYSLDYVADVTSIVTGSGNYEMTGTLYDSSRSTTGASIVVMYDDGDPSNNRDVSLFVGNDVNFNSDGIWDTTLNSIQFNGGTARFTFHVADGQPFYDGNLLINSNVIASGSIFEGALPSAGFYESMWDISSFDVTSLMTMGANTARIENLGAGDCLTLAAVVVDVTTNNNHPPVANAGPDQTVTATGSMTTVTLDGTGSTDEDGDSLSYEWSIGSNIIGSGASPTVSLPAGTSVVQLTVTDPQGESSTDTVSVSVQFAWSGLLQPINAAGTRSTFKLGSTVPIKFKLTGASSGFASLIATFSYRKIDSSAGSVNESPSYDAPSSGNTFRYDPISDQYIYNWGTRSVTTGAGTYEIKVDLGDGVLHTVQIDLR